MFYYPKNISFDLQREIPILNAFRNEMEDAHLVGPQVKLVIKQSSATCIWWARLFCLLFFLWPSHGSSLSDPWCDFLSELQKEKKLGNAGSPIQRSPGRVRRDSFTDSVYPGQKPAARPAGLKHKLLRLVKHLCPKRGPRRSEAAEFWWIFISYVCIQCFCGE